MVKQSDLSRMFWCIVAFLITFVTLTSAISAQDALDICNRIKSYKLKIRTMGLVGDLFIVLTDEGHLFYLPRDNLQNVDTSNPTLKIDHVPLNANRVFGAALDYNIRQDSSHLLFFLLVDSKSKIEFLMSLKVEQWLLRFQAHHLDWKKSHKRHKLNWTRNKEDDFMPLCFIVNADNAQCAQTIQMLKILNDNQVESRDWTSQQICMNGDSLSVFKPIESKFDSCFGSFSPESYTAFEWKGHQLGSPSMVSLVFHLAENGLYFKIKKIEGSFDCAESSWSSLSDFIQCGAHFTDNTSRWQPPEAAESSITSSNATQAITTTREKRTRWISGWTIVTVILIGLSACLVIMILRLYVKREPKKRNRKDKHSSIGSSAISSSAIGSSSTVDSSNVTSSGGLSSASSCPISAVSSSSSAVTSSMNSSGTSSAASQSKLSSNRSFMDGIFSWLKKHKKKNSKQRVKDKKAKENKKKGSKK